jgi:hypothetical protein
VKLPPTTPRFRVAIAVVVVWVHQERLFGPVAPRVHGAKRIVPLRQGNAELRSQYFRRRRLPRAGGAA